LPELIRAARSGNEVIIVAEDGTAAQLIQVVAPQAQGHPRFGSARGMFSMAEDFDAPLDDFSPYER
ncbi:MAG TPA: hypothetical protein VF541_06040, partial [Longimicrobium sp.]